MYKTTSYNSKGHLNITHSKEKVDMWTSSSKAFFMKDDMKVKVSNGTPKTLIPLDGVVNLDGVLKSGGRPEGDHAMHLLC